VHRHAHQVQTGVTCDNHRRRHAFPLTRLKAQMVGGRSVSATATPAALEVQFTPMLRRAEQVHLPKAASA